MHGGLVRASAEEDSYSLKYKIDLKDVNKVAGAVFFADTDRPKTYGHVLIDVLPKLWAYGEGRKTPPGTPLATTVVIGRTYAKMLQQLDVDVDSIVTIDRPTIVDEAYFPGIAFGRRDGAYPEAFEVFDRISRLKRESSVSRHKRIYISRRLVPGRTLVNEAAIEEIFSDLGFQIIHPQCLPIEDKIAIFAGAEFIAGPAGSALHNAVFSGPKTKILIIASSGWLHVIDMFINQQPGQLGYVIGDPLVPATGSRRRTSGEWSVDVDEVREAAHQHFRIGMHPASRFRTLADMAKRLWRAPGSGKSAAESS